MYTIRSAGTLIAAVLLVGGMAAVSPAAKADIDFECKPGCWGAIAASLSTGQEVIRYNYETQHEAEDAAVLWCDVQGKTNDCQVVVSGLGCLSVADGADGKAIAGRLGPTMEAADAAALDGAGPGSTISIHACNDRL